tara:strand:- start:32943 stop:33074 length:132 start_codon:yes stop_codon:yes gene_type:complete
MGDFMSYWPFVLDISSVVIGFYFLRRSAYSREDAAWLHGFVSS